MCWVAWLASGRTRGACALLPALPSPSAPPSHARLTTTTTTTTTATHIHASFIPSFPRLPAGKDRLIKYWDVDKFEQLLTLEGHCAEVGVMRWGRA